MPSLLSSVAPPPLTHPRSWPVLSLSPTSPPSPPLLQLGGDAAQRRLHRVGAQRLRTSAGAAERDGEPVVQCLRLRAVPAPARAIRRARAVPAAAARAARRARRELVARARTRRDRLVPAAGGGGARGGCQRAGYECRGHRHGRVHVPRLAAAARPRARVVRSAPHSAACAVHTFAAGAAHDGGAVALPSRPRDVEQLRVRLGSGMVASFGRQVLTTALRPLHTGTTRRAWSPPRSWTLRVPSRAP
jgi:hypothetical protein